VGTAHEAFVNLTCGPCGRTKASQFPTKKIVEIYE
jgi:hypothetical protein